MPTHSFILDSTRGKPEVELLMPSADKIRKAQESDLNFEVSIPASRKLAFLLSGQSRATPKQVGIALRELAEISQKLGGDFDAALLVRDHRIIGWGIDARSSTGVPMLYPAVMAIWNANLKDEHYDLSKPVSEHFSKRKTTLISVRKLHTVSIGAAIWGGVKFLEEISPKHLPENISERATSDLGPLHRTINSQLLTYDMRLKSLVSDNLVVVRGFKSERKDRAETETFNIQVNLAHNHPSWFAEERRKYSKVSSDEEAIRIACKLAELNISNRAKGKDPGEGGGPFGAVVYHIQTGEIVGLGCNGVERGTAAFLHGETVATLDAVKNLAARGQKLTAKDYALATSAAPCVMCSGSVCAACFGKLVVSAGVRAVERLTFFKEGPVPNNITDLYQARGIEVRNNVLPKLGQEPLEAFTLHCGGQVYNSTNNASAEKRDSSKRIK